MVGLLGIASVFTVISLESNFDINQEWEVRGSNHS